MMKRGNEHIGSKVKAGLPFTELCGSINFCIQFMWLKGSTFLAIATPSTYIYNSGVTLLFLPLASSLTLRASWTGKLVALNKIHLPFDNGHWGTQVGDIN
jgi:hypothetical protein